MCPVENKVDSRHPIIWKVKKIRQKHISEMRNQEEHKKEKNSLLLNSAICIFPYGAPFWSNVICWLLRWQRSSKNDVKVCERLWKFSDARSLYIYISSYTSERIDRRNMHSIYRVTIESMNKKDKKIRGKQEITHFTHKKWKDRFDEVTKN